MRDSKGVPELVKSIATDYSICVDQKLEELKTTAKEAKKTANRAMFHFFQCVHVNLQILRTLLFLLIIIYHPS